MAKQRIITNTRRWGVSRVATITKRKVHGHIYYYLVASKRIDGKPRLVLQKYLGRAEDVVAQLEGKSTAPQSVVVGEYGGSRALVHMARRLRLVEHVDAAAPKRDQGLAWVPTFCWRCSIGSWPPEARPSWRTGITVRRSIMICRSATRT